MTKFMAKEKEIKTNAMRILDRMKIPYTHYTYECDEFIDGMQIVEKLNLKPEQVYKTLVTQGHSKAYFVFVIPVAEELDLKLAQRVRNIRKRRSISQEKLASMSGVSYGSVKRFESTGQISLLSLTKVAMALDIADELRNIFSQVPYRDIKEVINETR